MTDDPSRHTRGTARYATIALVVAVLVAGCSGGATPTATTERPGTDTPTPTKTEPVDSTFAPGVTATGIDDVDVLLSAHRAALLAEGARIRLVTGRSAANGTVLSESAQTVEIGPAAEMASVNGSGFGPNGTLNVDAWLNETLSVFRFRGAGDTQYRVLEASPVRAELVLAGNIGSYVSALPDEFEVTSIEERNGLRLATLVANVDLVNDSGGPDTEMEVVVDSEGIIRSFSLSQTQPDGERYDIEYAVEATGVAPERPVWVDSIPDDVFLDLDLNIDVENGSVLTVANAGPDAVPAGSTVTVVSGGVTYDITLSEPVQAGTTRWIWVGSETGELHVGSAKPDTEVARSLGGQATVLVRTDDGILLASADLTWRTGDRG